MQKSRREAVKLLTLGSGLAMLPQFSLLSCTATPPDKKLGVALVGLGYYSTDLLAPALQNTQHCYLAGIVTGTPEKAVKWKEQYNIPEKNIYNYNTFDSIADNPDIDVIYIVLPPSMHHEYVIRAAKTGNHVWCEKPMAVTAQECQEMIDACNANGVKLSIGYRCQHEPNTIAYRDIVDNEKLGKVKYVDCAAGYREMRTDHWKQKIEMGGGVIYDMGVYSIQGARMGAGMEPLRVVEAKVWSERPEIYKDGAYEIVTAKLEFPGGVMADIKTSFAEGVNYLNIECEEGTIEMAPFSAYAGIKGKSPLGTIDHPYEVPWQQSNQMDQDALAIINDQPMSVPGEEGLRDLRIVEAILESAESGQPVQI